MTVEELQIKISAKVDGVLDKVRKVKESIAKIQPQKAPEVNVSTAAAQGSLKKLQSEVDRTQAKINKLNEKMNSAFTQQDAIAEKYKGLPNVTGMSKDQSYDYMVGNDPQMQALNAQIDALDAKMAPLKEHLAQTKAQMAEVGNAASSAAPKTEKLGNAAKMASNHLRNAGQSSGYFGRMVKSMMLSMVLYSGVSFIMKSIAEGFKDAARGNKEANDILSKYVSSFTYLKNAVAAPLLTILKAISPTVTNVVDGIAEACNKLAIFIAQITGQKTVTIAKKTNIDYAKSLDTTGSSASAANKKLKELQKTVFGFDELNILNKDNSTQSTKYDPDYKDMFETIKTPPGNRWDPNDLLKNIKGVFDRIDDQREKEEKAIKRSTESVQEKVKEGAEAVAKAVQQIPVPNLEIPPVYVPPLDDGAYQKSKDRYQQPVAAPAFEPLIAPAVVLDYFLYGKFLYQQPVPAPEVQPAVIPALDSSLFMPSFQPVESKANAFATNMQTTFGAMSGAMAASWTQAWGKINSETDLKSQAEQKKLSGFSAGSRSIFSGMESAVTAATSAMWQSVLSQTSSKLNSQTGNKVNAFSKGANQSFQDIAKSIPTLAKTTWLAVLTNASYYLGETHNRVNAKLKGISDDFAKFGTNLQANAQKTCQYQLAAFSTAFQSIGKALQSVGNWFSEAWNSAGKQTAAIQKANPPKTGSDLAGALTLGGASLANGIIPQILKLFGVAFSAKGGITTSPILSVVGEAGSEAILPLNGNTFSALAKGIVDNSKASGSGSMVFANIFNVDGKTDASIFGASGSKVKQITENLRTSADARKKTVSDETDYASKKYQAVTTSLSTSVPTFLTSMTTQVQGASMTIQTDTSNKWNSIHTFLSGKFSGISAAANTNFAAVKATEETNFAQAQRDVQSKSASMYSAASEKFKAIYNDANSYFGKVKTSAQSYMSGTYSVVDSNSRKTANSVSTNIGGAINGVVTGINAVLSAVGSSKSVPRIAVAHYAYGTGYHPGGAAIVNDQLGSTYREAVQLPDGRTFIPRGRNVYLPNLPRGSAVMPAALTAKTFKYASGVGQFFGTSAADMQKQLMDYIFAVKDPQKILQTAVDASTTKQAINEPWMSMKTSTVNYLTSQSATALKDLIKKFVEQSNGTAEALLRVASSQVGNTNPAAYWNFAGMQGAWCDMFVSWCLKHAGIKEGYGAYVPDTMDWYKQRNRWTDIPSPGSLIFYDWNNDRTPDHIGIVESIADGLVNTIEGNTTGPGGGTGVYRKQRHEGSSILGYAIPMFTGGAGYGANFTGSGVERWRSLATKALQMTGHYSAHNVDLLLAQMNTESSGQVNPADYKDVNYYAGHASKGLMQVIPETFASYAMPGYNTNILDPLSNILASIRYTWSRYGGVDGVWGQGHGYANGVGRLKWGGWNAKGGVFTAPTIAGLGDDGAEAALPLNEHTYKQIAQGISDAQKDSSDDYELLRMALASALREESGSGSVTVNSYVDSERVAQKVYAIQKRDQQRGRI